MSAYIQFFIKTNDNIYYPIGTFSRSTEQYKAFQDYSPWEKLAPLTSKDVISVIDDIERRIKETEDHIKEIEVKIDFLKTAEGSLDERMEYLDNYMEYKAEELEIIKEKKETLGFAYTLLSIIREAEDDEFCSDEYRMGLNKDAYVYVGIEVGNPNVTYAEDSYGTIIENRAIGYKKES